MGDYYFSPADPEVSFISESVTVSEGEGVVEVCLRLSVPLSTSLTVPLIFGSTGTTAISGTLASFHRLTVRL